MHKTTIKIIHWIWADPKLADYLREVAQGDEFEYGDEQLVSVISEFVFPEDRSRGILAWRRITEHDGPFGRVSSPEAEARVTALYESLTEGRKTPAGRLEWLSEMEPELIRDALLGREGDTEIYVHATSGHFHPNNRYRVDGRTGVYEPGWTSASGFWSLAEADRQVCPDPIGSPCGCTVVRRG